MSGLDKNSLNSPCPSLNSIYAFLILVTQKIHIQQPSSCPWWCDPARRSREHAADRGWSRWCRCRRLPGWPCWRTRSSGNTAWWWRWWKSAGIRRRGWGCCNSALFLPERKKDRYSYGVWLYGGIHVHRHRASATSGWTGHIKKKISF